MHDLSLILAIRRSPAVNILTVAEQFDRVTLLALRLLRSA